MLVNKQLDLNTNMVTKLGKQLQIQVLHPAVPEQQKYLNCYY